MSLSEPVFGDIFRAEASPVTRSQAILYLHAADENEWVGIDLTDVESGPQTYVSLGDRYPGWRYLGNVVPGVSASSFGKSRTTLAHLDRAEIAEMIAGLRAKGYTNIKVIAPSAIQFDNEP